MHELWCGLPRYIKEIPVAQLWQQAAKRGRRATANVGGWLAAAGRLARKRRAQRAANLDRAWNAVRRSGARIRLPEIPGGDPVKFGSAVGIALILSAGLAVVVGTALRQHRDEPETIANLSDYDWEWPAVEGPPAHIPQHTEDAGKGASGTNIAPAGKDQPEGLPGPSRRFATAPDASDLAPGDGLADEEENIVAARPLLDMPSDDDLALTPPAPEPPFPPTPRPRPEIQPQWLANAVEVQRAPGDRPMIAIVIDDAGVAQARTARAIALPGPLTIAFIPYGRNLEAQARLARRNGHELLLHIPMEPDSAAVDPGPNALLTSLDGDEIMRRFHWALGRFDGYVGVNNHMGSKFMARADLMTPLLAEMNTRGLLFLDSRTDKSTVGAAVAKEIGLPHASRQVFLDNELDAGLIGAQLERLEKMARRQGHAIAIGHPHDVTVDVLAEWIPGAQARGFDLVPVSAIVKLAYGGDTPSQLAAARGGEPDGLLGGAQ